MSSLINKKWHGYGTTDVGCVRKSNEDRIYLDNQWGLYLVADGMGGVNGGEVASGMVVQLVPRCIKKRLRKHKDLSSKELHQQLQDGYYTINEQICQAGKEQKLPEMGSTVVGMYIHNDQALTINVGDSRCYRLRNKKLTQLTTDHSVAQELLDEGKINEQRALTHPSQHILTRVMGMIDFDGADITLIDVQFDDQFLLCSDGLTNMVTDDELQIIVNAPTSSITKVRACIKLAKKNGGEDNISAILISSK